jgi:hypothetical protein
MDYAILTNEKDYTIFKFKNYIIRFKAPYSLEWYDKVTKWDNGFITVMTKYNYEVYSSYERSLIFDVRKLNEDGKAYLKSQIDYALMQKKFLLKTQDFFEKQNA